MNKKLRIINNVIMIIAIVLNVCLCFYVLFSDVGQGFIVKFICLQATLTATICLFCLLRFKDNKDSKDSNKTYAVYEVDKYGLALFVKAFNDEKKAQAFADEQNVETYKYRQQCDNNYEEEGNYVLCVVRELEVEE